MISIKDRCIVLKKQYEDFLDVWGILNIRVILLKCLEHVPFLCAACPNCVFPRRPWASLSPPPPPPRPGLGGGWGGEGRGGGREEGGWVPNANIWVPWPWKYTVQVVCKWAVAVCVCGAGSNKCTIRNSKSWWRSLNSSFIMTTKKKKRQKKAIPNIILLSEKFNVLQLFISLWLECVLVIGYCGRRNIKVPSGKIPKLTNVFP